MMSTGIHTVTGAFGYSGRYIASLLLKSGQRVSTLTNSPERANPFGGAVAASPFNFDDPERLTESLRGTEVLYNTYWVRYNSRMFTHAQAVHNSLILFAAAQAAGVRRVVHISITNPSLASPLEYFRGKAELEQALQASGLSYAILRPAVLFGGEDILINNIAWALRHLPVFGVFGDGSYCLQPIHVGDLAELAVRQGSQSTNITLDAIGPETFTYRELASTLGRIIGAQRPVISVPPTLGYLLTRLLGLWLHDVIITREEIAGLMANLLTTSSSPSGTTRLTDWAVAHADTLGRHYAGELARRRNRRLAYAQL